MLIYLNGTSSSGKTAVAQKLQRLLCEPYFYFSIDTLLYSLAGEDLQAIMGRRPYRTKINWDNIFDGYFSCVSSLIRTQNNVIADCPVYTDKLAEQFRTYVDPLQTKFVVGLECSMKVLEARELARGDRATGIAQKQSEKIHWFLNYDLKVDSGTRTTDELASEILIALG